MDTTQSSPGASNSSDFQPPTGNPQQVGTSMQSTNPSIQPSTTVGASQDELYRNLPSDLSVQTQGTPVLTQSAAALPSQAADNTFPLLGTVGVIAIVIAIIVAYRKWNIFSGDTAPILLPEAAAPIATVQPKKKSNKSKSSTKAKTKVKKPKKRR